jgi:hypothetical protein
LRVGDFAVNIIKHAADLPLGYRVEFVWTGDKMRVEWLPAVPAIRSRRAWNKFRAAYNAARRDFMKMIATTTAGSILIADIDGSMEIVRPGTKH